MKCSTAILASLVTACLSCAQMPPLVYPRATHDAFLAKDGTILVLGGENTNTAYRLERYSLSAGSRELSVGPPLLGSPAGAQRILLSGDRILDCEVDTCRLFDPATNAWQSLKVLGGGPNPIIQLKDGRLLWAGGDNEPVSSNKTFFIDPTSLHSTQTGNLKQGRWTNSIVLLADGRVLAAGGWFVTLSVFPIWLFSAEVFEPSLGTWSLVADIPEYGGTPRIEAVALPDGRALVGGALYDPAANAWTVLRDFKYFGGAQLNVLRNGSVLLSGGHPDGRNPIPTTSIFIPSTGLVRRGISMSIPRSEHRVVVLPDGRALALGGNTTGPVPTSSVEEILLEPEFKRTLDPGFYVATASEEPGKNDGFWSLQAGTSGTIDGGFFFGGLLPAKGQDVGFGAVDLPEAQVVRASVTLQPLPGSTGQLDFQVQILDAKRNPVGDPIPGTGTLSFSRTLSPGFYIFEIKSGGQAPAAAFQASLTAPHFAGGGSAGAVVENSAGVTGYVGFALSSKQDVTLRLFNEQTFGSPRGAGEVVLSLYDSFGNVLQRLGPGGCSGGIACSVQ